MRHFFSKKNPLDDIYSFMSENRIIYIYRVTCLINNKIYIGQSINPEKRWGDHKTASKNPKIPFHHAIKKHGFDNFTFEVIASCTNQDDANYTETELVTQYNSFVSNGCGYNATHGGCNAPKSDIWIQKMKDWHASLSPEEKARRAQIHREAFINLIKTKGHPGLGTKRTPEQVENLKKARQEYPVIYTDEIRKRMSDAHIGKQLAPEQVEKMKISIKENWNKRNEERFATGEIKCNAPGCEVKNKAKYKIIDGIRYCNKHGLRMLRTGDANILPKEYKPMSEESKQKLSQALKGKKAHNKIEYSEDQIKIIMGDNRSCKKIAKDFGVTEKVIVRIKRENAI